MERPILFSGAMVRAILEGRKSQTRRVVSPQPRGPIELTILPTGVWLTCGRDYAERAKHGAPGDVLWVRETWCRYHDGSFGYLADYPKHADESPLAAGRIKWRPSIYMPRPAARIQLKITSVRAERLNDITNADAEAEGVKCDYSSRSFRDHFADLWDSLNGGNGRGFPWRSNPFVWVITFARELQ